jgi:hypothetical protein
MKARSFQFVFARVAARMGRSKEGDRLMNSNEVMNIEAAPPRRRMVLALGRGK